MVPTSGSSQLPVTPILIRNLTSSGPHGFLLHIVYINLRKLTQKKLNPPSRLVGTLILGHYSWQSIIHFVSFNIRVVRLATTVWHVYKYLVGMFFHV